MKKQVIQKVIQKNNTIIYQAKSGAIELRGDFTHETVWATQAQMEHIFGIERSVVTKHIARVIKDGEIVEKSNVQKMHIANSDKPVAYYSLDVILSVGYRTNSVTAIEFRKWATQTLRAHITKGYTINRKQVQKNYQEFLKTVESIQNLLPDHIVLDPKTILELIKEFSLTWVSLDAYDKDSLRPIGLTKKSIKLTGLELANAIASLRDELLRIIKFKIYDII